MKTQDIDGIQIEGETHERVGCEDSDPYSSSESCTNIAISSQKSKNYNRETEAISSRKDEDLMIDDVVRFLKRLQERTNILEEKNKNISVQKTWVFGDNEIGQSSSSSVYQFKQGLPEIEAKAQGKNVLIRVHCENQQGYLAKVIGEIEKLDLKIDNISSLPFGDYFMDITVTAQVSSDALFMTMKDLKRELREALSIVHIG